MAFDCSDCSNCNRHFLRITIRCLLQEEDLILNLFPQITDYFQQS